jgi:hypothetical protein
MRKLLVSCVGLALMGALLTPADAAYKAPVHKARVHVKNAMTGQTVLESYNTSQYAVPVGVATGVGTGLLLSHGAFHAAHAGFHAAHAGAHAGLFGSLGASAAGAAAGGLVFGIGALVLTDAILQPCKGFHAMFLITPQEYCHNGEYVGPRYQQ